MDQVGRSLVEINGLVYFRPSNFNPFYNAVCSINRPILVPSMDGSSLIDSRLLSLIVCQSFKWSRLTSSILSQIPCLTHDRPNQTWPLLFMSVIKFHYFRYWQSTTFPTNWKWNEKRWFQRFYSRRKRSFCCKRRWWYSIKMLSKFFGKSILIPHKSLSNSS